MPPAREFEIIERHFTRATDDAAIEVGIGDDAAIIDAKGPLAITVDMLVAGTHFPATLPARAVGHRALAVNLSDLAAVAATPRWATLALSLAEVDRDWLDDFAAGFFALAQRFGVSLIGGDTTRGPLTMAVTVIGEASGTPLLRSGGRVGDRIFVSGTLGGAAAGLACLGQDAGEPSPDRRALIERFCYPEPRVELGLALAGFAHAAIDISDGLVADLGHICAGSGCGAALNLDALPLAPDLLATLPPDRCQALALDGGDDYELCFSVGAADAERTRAAAEAAGTPVTEIGELTASPGIVGRRDGTSIALEPKGFVHFE